MKDLVDCIIEILTAAIASGEALDGIEYVDRYAGQKLESFPAILIGRPVEKYKINFGNKRQLIDVLVMIEVHIAKGKGSLETAMDTAREWQPKVTAVFGKNPKLISASYPNGFALKSWTSTGDSGKDNLGGGTATGLAQLELNVRYTEYPA
jgi:hypothetical protein